jgi:sugar phosphate isomerase/epimerase
MTKLAFTTLACPDWSVPQVIDAARRYGYDGVELRLVDGEIIDPAMPREERQRIDRLFSEAGLPIVCVDTSIRLAAPEDPATLEPDLRAFLELAHEWRSPLIRVFGGAWPPERPLEQVYDGMAEALGRVLPDAERLGVAITLETHDAFSSAATVAEVLRRVEHPNFGALWDTHHPYRMGESPEQVLDLLGDRILHFHVKDARRRGDGWDLVLLGEGEVPVRESLAAVLARGYDRWVAVEWEKKWHPEIPDPEIALPQHAELLRPWLAEAGGQAGAGG